VAIRYSAPQNYRLLPPAGSSYPHWPRRNQRWWPYRGRFFIPKNGHWTGQQAPTSWLNADTALEQQELHDILQRCQEQLPPQHGAVFALRFVEELPAEEICQALGLSSANYWVIVHRAKLQLRRCLEKYGLGKN